MNPIYVNKCINTRELPNKAKKYLVGSKVPKGSNTKVFEPIESFNVSLFEN